MINKYSNNKMIVKIEENLILRKLVTNFRFNSNTYLLVNDHKRCKGIGKGKILYVGIREWISIYNMY